MFCKNCGAELAPDTSFCPACGTRAEEPAQEPAQEPAVSAQPSPAPEVNTYAASVTLSTSGSGKNGLIRLGACALVVILLIVGIVSCFGSNPKSVAKKYVEATFKCDIRASLKQSLINEKLLTKMLKDAAKDADKSMSDFYEAMEDTYDAKIRSVGDFLKAAGKKQKEYAEDKYGKYKVSLEVIDSEKMEKEDLQKLRDEIDDNDTLSKYLKGSKIKQAYEVKVKYKIKGKEDNDKGTQTVTVVKYGGSWKVFDTSMSSLSGLF